MKHKSHHVALAGSLTVGIWYSLCAAFLLFSKDLALKFHAYVMHLDNLDLIAPKIQLTWMTFLNGLALSMVSTYLFLLLFSVIYCYLCCHYGDGMQPGQGGSCNR